MIIIIIIIIISGAGARRRPRRGSLLLLLLLRRIQYTGFRCLMSGRTETIHYVGKDSSEISRGTAMLRRPGPGIIISDRTLPSSLA